jgi:chromosome segregation ATPase
MAVARSPKKDSALVSSATELEIELERWEELVVEAGEMDVTSDKQLQHAKSVLESCSAAERTMAEQLHAFVSAMQDLQARQRTCMEKTVRAARRVQERVEGRSALLERFAELGRQAAEINEPVATVMKAIGDQAPADDLVGPLAAVAEKTEAVASTAEAVAQAAREADWLDIAREADALKQQIQSVKNKVVTAHRNVATRASS